MLTILADTFRIATLTDRPWDRDTLAPERRLADRRRLDRWFWQGRTAARSAE